jgi:hypothetical protein
MSSRNRFNRRPRFIPLLKARKLRRQLSPELQAYVDTLVAQKWVAVGYDVELAKAATERQLNEDAAEYGLDPATILLLVQLAWYIYQALKYIGVFDTVTPELVDAVVDNATADDIDAETQVLGD